MGAMICEDLGENRAEAWRAYSAAPCNKREMMRSHIIKGDVLVLGTASLSYMFLLSH